MNEKIKLNSFLSTVQYDDKIKKCIIVFNEPNTPTYTVKLYIDKFRGLKNASITLKTLFNININEFIFCSFKVSNRVLYVIAKKEF